MSHNEGLSTRDFDNVKCLIFLRTVFRYNFFNDFHTQKIKTCG